MSTQYIRIYIHSPSRTPFEIVMEWDWDSFWSFGFNFLVACFIGFTKVPQFSRIRLSSHEPRTDLRHKLTKKAIVFLGKGNICFGVSFVDLNAEHQTPDLLYIVNVPPFKIIKETRNEKL